MNVSSFVSLSLTDHAALSVLVHPLANFMYHCSTECKLTTTVARYTQHSLWCILTGRVCSSTKNFITYHCSSLDGAMFVISMVFLHYMQYIQVYVIYISLLDCWFFILTRYLPRVKQLVLCYFYQDARKKLRDRTSWLPLALLNNNCVLLGIVYSKLNLHL